MYRHYCLFNATEYFTNTNLWNYRDFFGVVLLFAAAAAGATATVGSGGCGVSTCCCTISQSAYLLIL